jgi:hypothetical protein
MRYRVTGFDRSGSNLFSRVVEAIGPDHAKIVALVELRRSCRCTLGGQGRAARGRG